MEVRLLLAVHYIGTYSGKCQRLTEQLLEQCKTAMQL